MLPPSLRLLARHQVRSVPLRLQRRLVSTDTVPNDFGDLLTWAKKNRPKRSQSRSGNAQGGRSLKERKMRGVNAKQLVRSALGKTSKAMTREERIRETVLAIIYNEKALTSATSDWSGEDWKADSWGTDALKPPPSGRAPIVEAESHAGYALRVQGVLTPLGSPVLQDVVPLTEHRPIATLAHKLDRVLFNPGVHWLQEPRSGVYNFTPWLQNIPDVNDFAFERLPPFVKSSRDEDLWELAKREGKVFGGSTSSLTGMLSQVYFLISGIRTPDTSLLSKPFQSMPGDFTPGQRMPASVLLNHKDGVYAIDSAYSIKDDPDKNVLTWLGTLLEKFLTMPPEEFRRLLRDSPKPATDSGETREAYRYAKSRRLVMRSQLDCHDPRLPGTGVFDLKTRAALPVRMDIMNYKQHSTYLIRSLQGELESFEREYHDLIRSAFLKYDFQARIGNMDGILVAHHNTANIFGFRYIPLSEMDECLFGGKNRGEVVFEKCVLLLEEILTEVIGVFPDQTVRCLFETRDDKLDVFVEPEVHDESTGPRPIVHIVVQSTSYIDGNRVDSESAVAEPGIWNLHWTITHTSLSQEEKEHMLSKARERQWRAYSLPPGVSVEEMEEIWNQLDFGGKRRQVEGTSEVSSGDSESTSSPSSTFSPSFFAAPSRNVELLRELSMKGKVDMELMSEKANGRPKLIWGEPEAYCIDQVVGASELAGDSLVECGEVAPADEDIKANEVAASLADYSQTDEDRRL